MKIYSNIILLRRISLIKLNPCRRETRWGNRVRAKDHFELLSAVLKLGSHLLAGGRDIEAQHCMNKLWIFANCAASIRYCVYLWDSYYYALGPLHKLGHELNRMTVPFFVMSHAFSCDYLKGMSILILPASRVRWVRCSNWKGMLQKTNLPPSEDVTSYLKTLLLLF